MTLANRVSAFFLAALAVALGLSSTFIYVLVRESYEQDFDLGISTALNSLVAAIEAEPGELKWQPTEHAIALGRDGTPNDAVRWIVTDEHGKIVDHSRNLRESDQNDQRLLEFSKDMGFAKAYFTPRKASRGEFEGWRYQREHVVAPPTTTEDDEDDDGPQPDEFDELYVAAAMPRLWLDRNLKTLAWSVSLLPIATWLIAAALGRWFVVRAIAPVRAMAAKARTMTGDASHERLPLSPHEDELAELGRSFNALLDRRQRAFEEQRRFTGDAAHQLRTPLTVLAGQIDVALRRERGADEYRQTLGVLHEEVDELTKIVESLLFLARADGDAALPDREAFQLDRWLSEYFERWAEHPRRGDMTLDVLKPTTVMTSKALLAQLLDNLVSNAWKYSAAGTPIRIVTDMDARGATIAVADRGAGIAPEDQAAIFEPFVRTAEARQRGIAGTGLGLAIAARIARALGGDLSVASTPGRGSTFTLTLPVQSHG